IPERLLGKDFGLEALGKLRAMIAEAGGANRAEIAVRACEVMGWVTATGVPRLMSARAGLINLHRAGLIALPPPIKGNANGRRRVLPKQLELAGLEKALIVNQDPFSGRLDQLGAFWLRQVQGPGESALYYTLLERHHYLGAKLGGSPHQMRYFFGIEERLLGVIGFGPGASKVLAGCGRRLPEDFAARYGYAPVLMESFVERERFVGGCYRAANWWRVGQTCGRGKRDRSHRANLAIKDVWLYPLRADYRQKLRLQSA